MRCLLIFQTAAGVKLHLAVAVLLNDEDAAALPLKKSASDVVQYPYWAKKYCCHFFIYGASGKYRQQIEHGQLTGK